MKVTLRDVSKESGISLSTVYRIINDSKNNKNTKRRNNDTEQKVWDAVKTTGYIVDYNKPTIKRNKKGIGIISTVSLEGPGTEFYNELIQYLRNDIIASGYKNAYTATYSAQTEENFYSQIKNNIVSGSIIIGPFDEEMYKEISQYVPYTIYVGVNHTDGLAEEVICDGKNCTKDAVEHLINLGYTKIGYIGRNGKNSPYINASLRYKTYIRTMEAHNLKIYSKWVIENAFTTEDAVELTSSLLEQSDLPEAFFCDSDAVAIGVLHSCYKKNIAIPKQIAIVSVDDINIAKYMCPPLTTVQIPKDSMSRLALHLLCDKITTKRDQNIRVDVPQKLIIRGSCGASKDS